MVEVVEGVGVVVEVMEGVGLWLRSGRGGRGGKGGVGGRNPHRLDSLRSDFDDAFCES